MNTSDETKEIVNGILNSLDYAIKYGQSDGAHHKTWVIDQMVRSLTYCPMVKVEAIDPRGVPYTYVKQGESEEYLDFISSFCDGEDGPNTHEWDIGIQP